MKKKILIAICLIILLSIIGTVVYLIEKYYATDKGKTKIYQSELKDTLNLQGNKSVIKIIKTKFNEDEVEDYVVLMGECKYDEQNESKTTAALKNMGSNIEMYNNVSIDFVDGTTKETKRYDTKKSFGTDIELCDAKDETKKYVLVTDRITGNIAVLTLKDGNLTNLIENSFSGEFCGYTIKANFNKEDGTKLDVKLDNYGRNYLPEKKDTITLDFKDTDVNNENYRLTYMANKFTQFTLENKNDDPALELVCTQNILYSNKENVDTTAGKVIVTFKLNAESKYEVMDVVVEK